MWDLHGLCSPPSWFKKAFVWTLYSQVAENTCFFFFKSPYSSHDIFIRGERGRENCGKTWGLPEIGYTILRLEDLSRTFLNLPSHRMSSPGLVWVSGRASSSLLLSAPKLLPGTLRGKAWSHFLTAMEALLKAEKWVCYSLTEKSTI